jgi:hypothetical protein
LGVLAPLFLIRFIYHFDESTTENRLKTADVAVPRFLGLLPATLALEFLVSLKLVFAVA